MSWICYLEQKNSVQHDIEDGQIVQPEAPAIDITYNISLYSTEELQRPPTHRKPIAAYLVLKNDLIWIDFYAQMKRKACDALFPGQAHVDNNSFDMTFSVPRHITTLSALSRLPIMLIY